MNNHLELLKNYIAQASLPSWEAAGELVTHCPLNLCDQDSRGREGHFYISLATGQYHCKKCSESGNVITLAQALKDRGDTYLWDSLPKAKKSSNPRFATLVEQNHQALPVEIREYLNKRGISNETINLKKVGWVYNVGTYWIGFPVMNQDGKWEYYKLRENPATGSRKMTYPAGHEAQIYDWETLNSSAETIFICEGECDCLLLQSQGYAAITNTHGAGTFKTEWLTYFPMDKDYYIVYDTDEAGTKGAEKVAQALYSYGVRAVYVVKLPEFEGFDKTDVTDFFISFEGSMADILETYTKKYPLEIDTSEFREMSLDDVASVLSLTIKGDNDNKKATFASMINAYTDDSQFNISFNGPSSGGKSHAAIETTHYFPEEDVIKLGSVSPTAFFHEQGVYDKERNVITIDLSRKILVFLDMPHTQLLERIRPLLSHDEKVMVCKITDKSQKGGNRTKTVEIIGFPSVIFCTAGLQFDEQESTRFLLLSPEVTQEKLTQGVQQAISKGTDSKKFNDEVNQNPDRQLLMKRIRAIKQEKVSDVRIDQRQLVEEYFFKGKKHLKPKHQRDIKRILSLIKASALLNMFFRKREGSVVIANDSDISSAFALWDQISVCQELGIPPYIYGLFKEVIIAAFDEKNYIKDSEYKLDLSYNGLERKEIRQKHAEVYGRQINDHTLRTQILPMLEVAGLVEMEGDPTDKRKTLIFPVVEFEGRPLWRRAKEKAEEDFQSM